MESLEYTATINKKPWNKSMLCNMRCFQRINESSLSWGILGSVEYATQIFSWHVVANVCRCSDGDYRFIISVSTVKDIYSLKVLDLDQCLALIIQIGVTGKSRTNHTISICFRWYTVIDMCSAFLLDFTPSLLPLWSSHTAVAAHLKCPLDCRRLGAPPLPAGPLQNSRTPGILTSRRRFSEAR